MLVVCDSDEQQRRYSDDGAHPIFRYAAVSGNAFLRVDDQDNLDMGFAGFVCVV